MPRPPKLSTVDAYRPLAVLGRHPRIDAERIAVMGFSKGGSVALHSGIRRFQRSHGPGGLMFAAHHAFACPGVSPPRLG
jgi:hypothetical protein